MHAWILFSVIRSSFSTLPTESMKTILENRRAALVTAIYSAIAAIKTTSNAVVVYLIILCGDRTAFMEFNATHAISHGT